jgi:hypothetical protein
MFNLAQRWSGNERPCGGSEQVQVRLDPSANSKGQQLLALIRRPIISLAKDQSGQVLVFSAIMLTVLLGFAGLALDLGLATMDRRKAQVAADAAALAGAAQLPGSPGSIATSQATLNGFTAGSSVAVTVSNPPVAGAHVGDSAYVQVKVSKQVPTGFLRVLGINSVAVSANAIATHKGGFDCAIYVLDPTASSALLAAGNASVHGGGGCIQVNSNATPALKLNGGATVSADGAILVKGTCSGTTSPVCTTGQPVVPDPLASVPIPPDPGLPSSVPLGCLAILGPVICTFAPSTTQTISPGVYNSITAKGDLTLNAGTYIITGSFQTSSTARLRGTGVTLYFACPKLSAPYWQDCNTSGQNGGSLSLGGSAGFTLSAPTSGTYQGMLIFYDRNNTSDLSMTGNSNYTTSGTIYCARCATNLTGTSGSSGTFSSWLVTGTLSLHGTPDVLVDYHGDSNYYYPGSAVLIE